MLQVSRWAPSLHRLGDRAGTAGHAFVLLLIGLFVAVGCRMPAETGDLAPGEGAVDLRASIQSPAVSTLVTEVTGQGIPDPLVFNSELTGTDTDGNGVPDEFTASDVLVVPAGAARLFTVRAFDDGGVQTHEGTATTSVTPGPNASVLVITLQPLTGQKPIQVVLGHFDVTVTPEVAEVGVGAIQVFTAAVTDQDGLVEGAEVRWATSNPGVATVDETGVATGGAEGDAQVVATWMGVGAAAQLTVGAGSAVRQRIAFSSSRSGNYDLWVVEVDATGRRAGIPVQVTTDPAFDVEPTWSPDGTRIAFTSGRSGNLDIWVVEVDATGAPAGGPVQVTTAPDQDGTPAWSPDGTRIAFARYPPPPEDPMDCCSAISDIWVVEVDATGAPVGEPVQVTTDPHAYSPAWSPDGTRIAYRSGRGISLDIWVVEVDATGAPVGEPVLVTTNSDATDEGGPAWSPDGTRIAFRSDRSGNPDIWVVDVDATGAPIGEPVQVTTDPASDVEPTWSPGGTRIAFQSQGRGGEYLDIWVVEVDATGAPVEPLVQLTADPAGGLDPTWIVF